MDADGAKEEYCVVNVGRVVGKAKYALLDKADILMARHYYLRAQLLVDPNGEGAKVFVFAQPTPEHPASSSSIHIKALPLHELVWQAHRGDIPAGHTVVHYNDVTVDNRLANLRLECLESCSNVRVVGTCTIAPASRQRNMCRLFWSCVSQLPAASQYENVPDSYFYRSYTLTADSDVDRGRLALPVPFSPYYECHFLPCTSLEQSMLEFRMCGRCREVRYCSVACQEMDWAVHRLHCRPCVPQPPQPLQVQAAGAPLDDGNVDCSRSPEPEEPDR